MQHPRLHTWVTQGRDRSTRLMMCLAALALAIRSPTAPQNMHPGGNTFPVSASTQLHGVPCPPAWGDTQQASQQGRHRPPPKHPVSAPRGVPPPASRSAPGGVPRISPGMCHGHTSQPYTKVSCSGQGGAGCGSLPASGSSEPRVGWARAPQREGWCECPRAGERERCASLFYKCTNAP